MQRTGASRFAQRQIDRHRRLAPVADLSVWPVYAHEGISAHGPTSRQWCFFYSATRRHISRPCRSGTSTSASPLTQRIVEAPHSSSLRCTMWIGASFATPCGSMFHQSSDDEPITHDTAQPAGRANDEERGHIHSEVRCPWRAPHHGSPFSLGRYACLSYHTLRHSRWL